MMNFAIRNIGLAVPFTVAAIGLASPANAFHAPDRSANASEMAGVQAGGSSAPAAAPKQGLEKYCVSMPALTGSRMPTRQCKTRAEWEALGYELDDKK